MNPLSPLEGVAELIRRKVAAEMAEKGKLQGLKSPLGVDKKLNVPGKAEPEALKRKLLAQISAIDPQDPKREHKAATLFVENILVWQFGDQLRNDPSFATLVERVVETFENQPAIMKTLMELSV